MILFISSFGLHRMRKDDDCRGDKKFWNRITELKSLRILEEKKNLEIIGFPVPSFYRWENRVLEKMSCPKLQSLFMHGREKTPAFLPYDLGVLLLLHTPVCCVPGCRMSPKAWGRGRFAGTVLWWESLFIYLLRLSVFLCSLKLTVSWSQNWKGPE